MNDKTVIMPAELTAENGAKGLLIGEFSETVIMACNECDGGSYSELETEICECGGSGEYSLKVPVSWTMIKEIYALAVKHLEIKENKQ